MLTALLTLTLTLHPTARCDAPGGPVSRTGTLATLEDRTRLRAACEAVGGSPLYCAYVDAVGLRESSWRRGVRHDNGADADGREERGLGILGLSVRWHHDKWPGDPDPDWCQPEASFAVLHAIAWRAVDRWHARDLAEVQAVYGGHWRCSASAGRRTCELLGYPSEGRLHGMLRRRGHSAYTPISARDLGERLPKRRRATWAREQAHSEDVTARILQATSGREPR